MTQNCGVSTALYSPLTTEYCTYFYVLSVVGLLCFVLSLIIVVILWSKGKGDTVYYKVIMMAIGYFIFYFQNRLLYSMCFHSTQPNEGFQNNAPFEKSDIGSGGAGSWPGGTSPPPMKKGDRAQSNYIPPETASPTLTPSLVANTMTVTPAPTAANCTPDTEITGWGGNEVQLASWNPQLWDGKYPPMPTTLPPCSSSSSITTPPPPPCLQK
jgi:hypothetical protein